MSADGSATYKKTIPHTVEIKFDGATLAMLFWELGSDQQAMFFNELGFEADRLPFQLQAVTDCEKLMPRGRTVMHRIGEYAEATQ